MKKTYRFLISLTVINLALLAFSLYQSGTVQAQWGSRDAGVLRGRALEIVDDRGRVRASLSVLPANPSVRMPDGTTGHPEMVLLRLSNSAGRPNVRIYSTERAGGQYVTGETDPVYIQMLAEGPVPRIRMSNQEGEERVVTPTSLGSTR